jgi:hypothetical protein
MVSGAKLDADILAAYALRCNACRAGPDEGIKEAYRAA